MTVDDESLWVLFGGDDPRHPGRCSRSFAYVLEALQDWDELYRAAARGVPVTSTKPKKMIALKNTSRFYLLVGRERRARVEQALLVVIGKAMRDRELKVQYLGMVE